MASRDTAPFLLLLVAAIYLAQAAELRKEPKLHASASLTRVSFDAPYVRTSHELWNMVLPSQEQQQAALERGLRDPGLIWSQCSTIASLGPVCIGVYGDPTAIPATVGVEITFMNRTFLLPVIGAQACLDDSVLLALLLRNPELKQFAEQLQILIQAEKLLGAEALSMCVLLTNATININKEEETAEFAACPRFQLQLGCFRYRCLFKRKRAYNCFNVHFPRSNTVLHQFEQQELGKGRKDEELSSGCHKRLFRGSLHAGHLKRRIDPGLAQLFGPKSSGHSRDNGAISNVAPVELREFKLGNGDWRSKSKHNGLNHKHFHIVHHSQNWQSADAVDTHGFPAGRKSSSHSASHNENHPADHLGIEKLPFTVEKPVQNQ